MVSRNPDPATTTPIAALGADRLYAAAVKAEEAGSPDQAVVLYHRVLALTPDHIACLARLSNALAALGKFDEAAAAMRRMVAIRPDDAEAHCNLGDILTELNRFDEAIAAYRRAIAIRPDFADAYYHLGSVLSETGDVAEGFSLFMRRAELEYGPGTLRERPPRPEPLHKTRHDTEQRDYLAAEKLCPPAATVGKVFYIADGNRLQEPAVNPANATAELLSDWRIRRPQLVVIENFLMPDALEKLRKFCAQSTVWRKIYKAGYLGAAPEDGFACPLLAQIVEEVGSTYSAILGAHRFRYLGAFKYDSELSTGTNTHADNAAVNVNLYIAPDEANLDPDSGGMVIWNVAARNNAEMRKYNSNEGAARDFLARSGAKPEVIPHRANRAVIFKSDLFHKTDDCRFASGYLNKRINVSMLFGELGAPT